MDTIAIVTIWLLIFLAEVVPFGVYLLYMRRVALGRPWDIKMDDSFEPNISILLPIYNEASVIEKKLDNIVEASGNYPRQKLEIVIVDSASTDDTAARINNWRSRNLDISVNLFVEGSRRGMVHAENVGLELAKHEIVVKTDADCFWRKDSLRNALKYLADPTVGAVAGLHDISSGREGMALEVEKKYRDFYAWLRVGESKIFGTVLYEGELMAFRRDLVRRLGGFDEDIGGDDVPLALNLAKNHYRAISASDAFFVEFVPYTWRTRFSQKVRRGKHVVQALLKYRNTKMNGRVSNLFVPMETYIYVLNPILFFALCAASIPLFYVYPFLLLGLIPIAVIKSVRELFTTHATNSMIMVGAMLGLVFGSKRKGHDVMWSKVEEIRDANKGAGQREEDRVDIPTISLKDH